MSYFFYLGNWIQGCLLPTFMHLSSMFLILSTMAWIEASLPANTHRAAPSVRKIKVNNRTDDYVYLSRVLAVCLLQRQEKTCLIYSMLTQKRSKHLPWHWRCFYIKKCKYYTKYTWYSTWKINEYLCSFSSLVLDADAYSPNMLRALSPTFSAWYTGRKKWRKHWPIQWSATRGRTANYAGWDQ